MDVLTIQWGWLGGKRFGGTPPTPPTPVGEARAGDGRSVYYVIGDETDEELMTILTAILADG